MLNSLVLTCASCTDQINADCCGGQVKNEMFEGLIVQEYDAAGTTLIKTHFIYDGYKSILSDTGVFVQDAFGNSIDVKLEQTNYADIAALKTAIKNCKCPVGGGGGGDTVTSFNWVEGTSTLTLTTNTNSFPLVIDRTTATVTISADIDVNGTNYPAGTDLQTVLAAIAGAAHPAMAVTNNAAPFSFDLATQVLNIPAITKVDNGDGTETVTIGGVAITTQNGETSIPHTVGTTTFPVGTDIDTVIAAMITTIVPNDFVELTDADIIAQGGTAGNPTEAIVDAHRAANGIVGTSIYYVGAGSAMNPDYVWKVDDDGTLINDKRPSAQANDFLIISDADLTAINPAHVSGSPLTADVNTFIGNGGHTDVKAYYSPTGVVTTEPTHTYKVDGSGAVILDEKPSVAGGFGYYDAGLGWMVDGSEGIVVTSNTDGVYNMLVPDGGQLNGYFYVPQLPNQINSAGGITLNTTYTNVSHTNNNFDARVAVHQAINSSNLNTLPLSSLGVNVTGSVTSAGQLQYEYGSVSVGVGLKASF